MEAKAADPASPEPAPPEPAEPDTAAAEAAAAAGVSGVKTDEKPKRKPRRVATAKAAAKSKKASDNVSEMPGAGDAPPPSEGNGGGTWTDSPEAAPIAAAHRAENPERPAPAAVENADDETDGGEPRRGWWQRRA
jgi:ribonuclease E